MRKEGCDAFILDQASLKASFNLSCDTFPQELIMSSAWHIQKAAFYGYNSLSVQAERVKIRSKQVFLWKLSWFFWGNYVGKWRRGGGRKSSHFGTRYGPWKFGFTTITCSSPRGVVNHNIFICMQMFCRLPILTLGNSLDLLLYVILNKALSEETYIAVSWNSL